MKDINNVQLFLKLYNYASSSKEEMQEVLAELEARLSYLGFFPEAMVNYTYLTDRHSFKWFSFSLSTLEMNQPLSEVELLIRLNFSPSHYTLSQIKARGATRFVDTEFNLHKASAKLDGRSKKSIKKELNTILTSI